MFYKSIKSHAEQFLGDYKKKSPATFAAAQEAIGGLLILDGFVGIDNPLGGKKRSGIFGCLIGMVIGLVFLFGGNFMANLFGISKMTAATPAKVVSVSQPTTSNNGSSCTPHAIYNVNGREYDQTSSVGSSSACSLSPGETININYDPNNPGSWAYDLNSVKTVLKFLHIVGAVVIISNLVTFTIRLFSIIFGWKLLKSGRALAKTLPAGTNLSTIKKEVEQNFAKSVFGMGGKN